MASEDIYSRLIEELNVALQSKCPDFIFFMKSDDDQSEWRIIGIKYKGIDASTIQLREPETHNGVSRLRIEYSMTKDYVNGKKMTQRYLNTCIRHLAAIIASHEGHLLESLAQSPISLYSMTKLFECEIRIFGEGDFEPIVKGSLSLEDCRERIREDAEDMKEYEILAKTSDFETLKSELLDAISTIKCETLGGKRKRRTLRSKPKRI